MSDPVTIAAISACVTVVMQLLNMYSLSKVRQDTAKTHEDMRTLEKNTNSIKDALVKATAEQKYAEGLKDGLKDVEHP
jgi:hypothetical protein